MTKVTREEFFRFVNPRNVNPTPVGKYEQDKGGYFTEWRTPSGMALAYSWGDRYWLAHDRPAADNN